jgi:amidase
MSEPHHSPTDSPLDRRAFLRAGAAGVAAVYASRGGAGLRHPEPPPVQVPAFDLDETTIEQLQDAMKSGRYTAAQLTMEYMARIGAVDRAGPRVNAVIELNPDALAIADRLDAERKAKGPRGPLHGIPVLIKDNIDTADRMRTSAGSLALGESIAPRDAFIVQRLREAGAVLLGKTNLSEWANFRSTRSTSGWSGRGGLTRNPYALDRNACGSSSGTGAAVAANFAAIGVGTETDGSIVCPSSANGLVGLKPTVGLWSRSGIVPISHSQDTAGPMCRSVRDAAILLGALAGSDVRDASTASARGRAESDYTGALDTKGLSGARIGVLRAMVGGDSRVARVFDDSLAAMKSAGAVLVDPVDIPNASKLDDPELDVLLYEFKADINAYLATSGSAAAPKNLADLIVYNVANRDREMPYFNQELFERAQAKGPLTSPSYRTALALCRRLARADGIDLAVRRLRLDALVAPTGGPAWVTDLVNGDHFTGSSSTLAAVAGYPSVTVPAGLIFGLPVGISFMGIAWSEARLLRLAYAFEQQTHSRRPPRFLPTAPIGS